MSKLQKCHSLSYKDPSNCELFFLLAKSQAISVLLLFYFLNCISGTFAMLLGIRCPTILIGTWSVSLLLPNLIKLAFYVYFKP